jgi:hypothetical protein
MLPPKSSLHCGYGQIRQSIWVMDAVTRMLFHNFNGTFPPYFNDTRWRETTMPTIFRREVVDGVWVMGISESGGA